MAEVIAQFRGEYRFLSNFWVHEDGLSVEHHYQAAKAASRADWDYVMSAKSPGQAKRRGSEIDLRPGWNDQRIDQMRYLVYQKFYTDSSLREKLLATGDAILIEGNTWNDTFWGVNIATGEGENNLGMILMATRELLRATPGTGD